MHLGRTTVERDSVFVYVFDVSQGENKDQWTQVAKLVPNDARAGLGFGSDVAIDGDTIVVAGCGIMSWGNSSERRTSFNATPSAQTCGRRWRFSGAMKYREDSLVQVSPSTMTRSSLANQGLARP